MNIKELQKSYQQDASILGDYQAMSKTELANGYCDAEENNDEILRSAYASALMIRYWYKIWEWRENSKSLNLYDTDFVDWLVDSLHIALTYKIWRYEFKPEISLKDNGKFLGWKLDENGNKIPNPYYYKVDPDAPDKIINRCCFSTRGREYQYHNKDVRKSNTQTLSLDSLIDEDGDYAVAWTGCVVKSDSKYNDNVYNIISDLVSNDKLLECLVVDGIAHWDAFKVYKKEMFEINESGEEENFEIKKLKFDNRKLVKHLTHIDKEFIVDFCNTYDINKTLGNELYYKLKLETKNKGLYKLIEKTKADLLDNPNLLNYLNN